jgi:hypothetical protein
MQAPKHPSCWFRTCCRKSSPGSPETVNGTSSCRALGYRPEHMAWNDHDRTLYIPSNVHLPLQPHAQTARFVNTHIGKRLASVLVTVDQRNRNKLSRVWYTALSPHIPKPTIVSASPCTPILRSPTFTTDHMTLLLSLCLVFSGPDNTIHFC